MTRRLRHHEPNRPDPATSAIVRAAKSGDAERLGQLYERVAPALYAWANLRIGAALVGRLDPEDVVQEVWCRALLRFDSYDPKRSSFRTWVFGIANNVLLEAFRRLGPRNAGCDHRGSAVPSFDDVPEAITSVSRRLARHEGLRRFIERVGELDSTDRELLLYCGLEGLSRSGAAELLGLSVAATTKRWQRLVARLRGFAMLDELIAT